MMREGLILVEVSGEKFLKFADGALGVGAFGGDVEFAAWAGGEHHKAHDTLAVDDLPVFFDEDIAGEAVGGFDEHRGGPGVDAQFIGDLK